MNAPKRQHSPDFFSLMAQHAEAMLNYRHLTQDNRYGSRVQNGKIQLVCLEYAASGESTVIACSRWIKAVNWLRFMRRISF